MKILDGSFPLIVWATIALSMIANFGAAKADMVHDCANATDAWSSLAACTKVIESDGWTGKRVGWAYSNRAVAHAELGNSLAAFDDHNQAILLDPTDPKAWNNRATSHAAFREYARALSDYDQALRLDPDYLNALVNRASVHFESGRPLEAVADYDSAIALAVARQEKHDELLFLRADVACELGQVERSLADRKPALESGTFSPERMATTLEDSGYVIGAEGLENALRAWTEAGCP